MDHRLTHHAGIVDKIAEAYKRQLRTNIITFGALLCIYLFITLVAAVIVTVSAIRRRHQNDPDDEPQYVFLAGEEPERIRHVGGGVEVSRGGENEKTAEMEMTPAVLVNPPTPERTTTIVPSPAYSNRISWVYDAEHPELSAIRLSTLNHLNNVIDSERRNA